MNVYTTLLQDCKWTLFYIRLTNVRKTLSDNSQISYYLNVDETLHIRL